MNIYESLNKVMAEVGAIGKTSKSTQGYQYRGIDAVMNALQPALIKNKVFISPEVLEHTREERQTAKGGLLIYSIIKMKYKFYAEDGTCIEAVTIGEGMDSSDKSSNKAMSNAFKYACFQVLCIPTEEMLDSEASNPIAEADRKAQEEAPKPTEAEVINAEQLSQLLAECKRLNYTEDQMAKAFGLAELKAMPKNMFAKAYKSALGWK